MMIKETLSETISGAISYDRSNYTRESAIRLISLYPELEVLFQKQKSKRIAWIKEVEKNEKPIHFMLHKKVHHFKTRHRFAVHFGYIGSYLKKDHKPCIIIDY